MKTHLGGLALAIGLAALSTVSVKALELTKAEEQCEIAKAKATAKHFRCLTNAKIRGIKRGLSEQEINRRTRLCELKHAGRFAKAEARAEAKGETCVTLDDASGIHAHLIGITNDLTPKTIFVTSQTFDGDLLSEANENFDCDVETGLAGGDCICQSIADNADPMLVPPGVYKAWLSAGFESPAGGRWTQSTTPYVLVNGTEVASDWDDLLSLPLGHEINRDEANNLVVTSIWTGTLLDGSTGRFDCLQWHHGGPFADGIFGTPLQRDSRWTNNVFARCDSLKHLYCGAQ